MFNNGIYLNGFWILEKKELTLKFSQSASLSEPQLLHLQNEGNYFVGFLGGMEISIRHFS